MKNAYAPIVNCLVVNEIIGFTLTSCRQLHFSLVNCYREPDYSSVTVHHGSEMDSLHVRKKKGCYEYV